MAISTSDVKYVADLANLELTDEETARMQRDLSAILEYIAQLGQVKTADIEPMAQALGGQAPDAALAATLRTDEPRPSLGTDLALANAPAAGAGHFKVPRIIGGS